MPVECLILCPILRPYPIPFLAVLALPSRVSIKPFNQTIAPKLELTMTESKTIKRGLAGKP